MITDEEIRRYRDERPLLGFSWDIEQIIKIALGKRRPRVDMTKQQAREWIERAAAGKVGT